MIKHRWFSVTIEKNIQQNQEVLSYSFFIQNGYVLYSSADISINWNTHERVAWRIFEYAVCIYPFLRYLYPVYTLKRALVRTAFQLKLLRKVIAVWRLWIEIYICTRIHGDVTLRLQKNCSKDSTEAVQAYIM